MHESSTIDYDCPDWCERTDHQADEVEAGDFHMHYGPDFGPIGVQGRGDSTFDLSLSDEGVIDGQSGVIAADDTQALLDFARDLGLAANWIELHR